MSIVIYGADWCPDCTRAKFFFQTYTIPYEYHDVDKEGYDKVHKYSNGGSHIPVIIFEDQSILIEPTFTQLQEKLGVQ